MRSKLMFMAVFLLAFCVNAYGIQVSVPELTADPGATITVEISADDVTGIAGGDIMLDYDPAILEAKEARATALLTGLSLIPNVAIPGKVILSMAGVAGLAGGSGAIVEVDFQVKADASGVSPLTLSDVALFDELGMDIEVTVVDGSVTVEGVEPEPTPEEANKAFISEYLGALSGKEKTPELVDQFVADSDQALKDHIAMFEAGFPLYELLIDDMVAEGDKVAIRTTAHLVHTGDFVGIPPTGVEATVTINLIYRIAEGKIVEHWMEADQLGLMQQLGVVDPAGREDFSWGVASEVTGDPGTPEANEAVLMRFIDEFWNQYNVDIASEILSDDLVNHNPSTSALYPSDLEGLKQFATDVFAAFPDFSLALDDLVIEGDRIMVRWTTSGTHQDEFMGIPATGKHVSVTGQTLYRFADGKIVEMWWAWDTMGMMAQLTPPEEPEKDYSNVFFMSLAPGLNMISLPLEPVEAYTARSFAEEIGATVVIRYDEVLKKFKGFTPEAPDDGFAIEGGKGYIVNVPEGGVVSFVGAAWTNEPPVEAAPPITGSGTWAFVVSGSVLDGDEMNTRDGGYTVTVKNLRTGATATETAYASGYFAAAWADLNRKAVVEAGDKLEVAVMDSSGKLASGPFIHEVTLDELRNAVLDVRLRLGEIIPEKPALLQNYPNPFNPETWIPFRLNDGASVSIRVYSAAGQLIRTLDLGHKDAGVHVSRSRAAYWDGKNEAGEEVASGIYFYNITTGDFSATKKMVIRK